METSEQVWRDALGSAIEEVFDTMVLRDFVEEPGLDVPAILGDKACVMTVELFGSSWARIVLRIRASWLVTSGRTSWASTKPRCPRTTSRMPLASCST